MNSKRSLCFEHNLLQLYILQEINITLILFLIITTYLITKVLKFLNTLYQKASPKAK